ncbi:MAG: M23 family metallopeptidase [Synechococcaceae cyanobacterium SM2_3_1]|nr:M23 family metallopeptidase [Synechococcaceae cyanobacterium SM2_3_1]
MAAPRLAILSWDHLPAVIAKAFLTLGLGWISTTVTLPGEATQVKVNPPTPPLGYTISVLIETAPGQHPVATPAVSFRGQEYPAFTVGTQQWRALLPTSPLDSPGLESIQIQGFADPTQMEIILEARDFPVQRVYLSPQVASLEPTELEIIRVAQFREQATPEKHWQGYFIPPSQGPVSTIFGVRRYYNDVFAENYYHRGIDYAGPVGSVVVAPAAGRVGLVGYESDGFRLHGNMVGLDHGQGVTSVLLHLSRIDVKEGERVEAGQAIGAIGATGIATGPHLHWGLFVHGVSVDPIPWMHLNIR